MVMTDALPFIKDIFYCNYSFPTELTALTIKREKNRDKFYIFPSQIHLATRRMRKRVRRRKRV